MALSIDDIANASATAIEAATPDYEPNITYRELPGDTDIFSAQARHHPDLTTREFQVWPGESVRFSNWNGNNANLWADLNVAVRYQVMTTSSGEWLRLKNLIGTDILRIANQLNKKNTAAWAGTNFRMITEPLVEVTQHESDVHILLMTYQVNLDLAE